MKKNVWIYGLILGFILTLNAIIQANLFYTHPDMKRNDVLGYTFFIVVMSLIFFGIRNYRNKFLNGFITFGKAFKTGALIALVASTMYVVVWIFSYYLFFPDFLDQYIPYVLKQAKPEQLAAKTVQMENFREMYKNPLFVIATTFMEVLPIGLVVALVSALILKRKA